MLTYIEVVELVLLGAMDGVVQIMRLAKHPHSLVRVVEVQLLTIPRLPFEHGQAPELHGNVFLPGFHRAFETRLRQRDRQAIETIAGTRARKLEESWRQVGMCGDNLSCDVCRHTRPTDD